MVFDNTSEEKALSSLEGRATSHLEGRSLARILSSPKKLAERQEYIDPGFMCVGSKGEVYFYDADKTIYDDFSRNSRIPKTTQVPLEIKGDWDEIKTLIPITRAAIQRNSNETHYVPTQDNTASDEWMKEHRLLLNFYPDPKEHESFEEYRERVIEVSSRGSYFPLAQRVLKRALNNERLPPFKFSASQEDGGFILKMDVSEHIYTLTLEGRGKHFNRPSETLRVLGEEFEASLK